ncbi:hypothetical protein [Pseudoalteromonas sp. S558]|uniref:hypothetical protein n=1 Tax=Pseudoalteromonas sp. S558 TaxID=2066515 RepID=UPI00110A371E|nr:hypothetical protein [Pseudoalteromonas sp. S558]TMN95311.1 hypothetical protein CWB66_18585 [Pseudoalteromonas sp. S558]
MDEFTRWAIAFALFLGVVATWVLPKKWFKLAGLTLIVIGVCGVFSINLEIFSAFCFSCIPIGFGLLSYDKKYIEP